MARRCATSHFLSIQRILAASATGLALYPNELRDIEYPRPPLIQRIIKITEDHIKDHFFSHTKENEEERPIYTQGEEEKKEKNSLEIILYILQHKNTTADPLDLLEKTLGFLSNRRLLLTRRAICLLED